MIYKKVENGLSLYGKAALDFYDTNLEVGSYDDDEIPFRKVIRSAEDGKLYLCEENNSSFTVIEVEEINE